MAYNPDVYLQVNLEKKNCYLANLNYPSIKSMPNIKVAFLLYL